MTRIPNPEFMSALADEGYMVVDGVVSELPVFPNGYARQSICACKKIDLGRTMIDGEWRLVCMKCGSLRMR